MAALNENKESPELIKDLIFLEASAGASPKTAEFAPRVRAAAENVRSRMNDRISKEEEEVRTMALRNAIDRQGDLEFKDFANELRGLAGTRDPLVAEILPEGSRYETEAVGAEQVKRRDSLRLNLAQGLQSALLLQHPKRERIEAHLRAYQEGLEAHLAVFRPAVDRSILAAQASDLAWGHEFAARRHAVEEFGSVLGLIREKMKGSASAANDFTRPSTRRRPQEEKPDPGKPDAPPTP